MNTYRKGSVVPSLYLARKFLKKDRRSEPRPGERVPYVIVHGIPGLPLIQLVRTPYEVLSDRNLRLNSTYYITKQICPSLERIFYLVGVNVYQWYTDLPKVSRVFDQELIQETFHQKKGTISHYFQSTICQICEEKTFQGLCLSCMHLPQHTSLVLTGRIQNAQRKFQHLNLLCAHCSGYHSTKNECMSLDCPTFYKLYKVEQKIKVNEHLISLIDLLPS